MSKRHAAHGEGSVYKSSDPKRTKPWVVQITANGRRKTNYYATQKEALAAKRKMLHELEQGQLVTAKQQTVKAYLEQWLQAKRMELKAGTYQYYRLKVIRYIIPALGHLKLQKLTDTHIQALYARLLETLSPNTVRLTHGILYTALSDAVKQHKLMSNPAQFVTLPRKQKQELAYLTPEQMWQFLNAARGYSLECLFITALATGMRQGELLALRWADIDLERKTVHVVRSLSFHDPDGAGYEYTEVEPKTQSSRRTIPLTDFALASISEHRKRQLAMRLKCAEWQNKDLVFTNSTGGFVHISTLTRQLRRILASAGLPLLRFHDLRHTAATNLLSLGVSPRVVQEWLGHSDISITLGIYAHVTQGMKQQAMDLLNEQFRRTGEI